MAGEDINGQFSSFTQVGACNAPAFFAAANTAIRAGKLTVPQPGIARDGQRCLTTRSFALIDQDQSDNVTTEYLAEPNGQIAQDTAANKQGLNGSSVLFNGSDNGLLDLFVDPALGCSPWEAPNLADGGAPAPSLPLDELQAARWANSPGSPAALVPLNDPMTVDENGNFSTDKTNTYRSLVDMSMLPAGQSPAAYCSDMEQIQGKRLQQDVNLLLNAPSPSTGRRGQPVHVHGDAPAAVVHEPELRQLRPAERRVLLIRRQRRRGGRLLRPPVRPGHARTG